MEVIDNRPTAKPRWKKNDVVVAVLIWNVTAAVASWIATYAGPVYSGVSVVQAVGNSFATLAWCHIDAIEREYYLGPGFRFLALVLGPIALLYYLPKSRGGKRGMKALMWALGLFLLLVLVTSVANILVNLIEDRMGLFAVAP